jgi:HSP20 family protein
MSNEVRAVPLPEVTPRAFASRGASTGRRPGPGIAPWSPLLFNPAAALLWMMGDAPRLLAGLPAMQLFSPLHWVGSVWSFWAGFTETSPEWSPHLEVLEDEDALTVRVDLPGLRREDVSIEVHSDRLVVKGQRQPAALQHPSQFFRLERRYGHFSRTVPLPRLVDAQSARATFQDGVLEIVLERLHAMQRIALLDDAAPVTREAVAPPDSLGPALDVLAARFPPGVHTAR